uniref:Imidazole glycerol phosphate synthase subunit HisH n=1 Tax=Gloeochaete wittrockiana TaxID=38269 RepID=A0A3G1IVQ0_9EUKA|nr:imidazole glycerol phosphate synthase subunit hisH [Gloeochaete wittrockiana]YP_009546116.1 imidazole glycerol phosphate synthase subunit hisH [Gloeochaete wittrockiana]ASQ40120.1 imidazole glycerol phosphate synthase subunit hisH [Gloeochaete wittrockiana]ASQ40177.1 imidazole glycerol phosphate synthase subunit hisH [Gloeochaete wittrockiana]
MLEIAVVDYEMGNLYSVVRALQFLGVKPVIVKTPEELEKANAIILPGVGAFDPAINQLRQRQLVDPIRNFILEDKPFLGICLGLQLLFDKSEEGNENGLGILRGNVKKFKTEPNVAIPHMGWNQLKINTNNSNCMLWKGLKENPWVYFVHSYYVTPLDKSVEVATVLHGTQEVVAAVARKNLVAVQFHPEKSVNVGLQILKNFVSTCSC